MLVDTDILLRVWTVWNLSHACDEELSDWLANTDGADDAMFVDGIIWNEKNTARYSKRCVADTIIAACSRLLFTAFKF
jgi:hypothetical protein